VVGTNINFCSYLSGLFTYLLSFSKRTQPLVDIDALQMEAEKEFDDLWEQGQVPGWEITIKSDASGEGIWCAACM
jgi:splicing factor 3A subunit 3